MKKHLLIGLFVYWIICLFPPLASGEVMSDNNYTIEKQDIEIGQVKKPTPTPIKQPEKPFASGDNYTVETTNPAPFLFSLSHELLNFGKPTATNPVIRLLYLTTTSTSPYAILSTQNHQFSDGDKIIPDTTCDNGSCSQTKDAGWTSTLTYGFGYQTPEMSQENYKQFADLSQKELPEILFFHSHGTNLQEKITYKINVSGTQQPGAYSNVITYIAIPEF